MEVGTNLLLLLLMNRIKEIKFVVYCGMTISSMVFVVALMHDRFPLCNFTLFFSMVGKHCLWLYNKQQNSKKRIRELGGIFQIVCCNISMILQLKPRNR